MRIALDFDDTITRDPTLWQTFIADAVSRGHEVRIVTYRHEGYRNEDVADFVMFVAEAYNYHLPVIYTNGQRKRYACGLVGFFPDVWIDDVPELIVAASNQD